MASTYSNLKFELIGTGDQPGAWGTTTNTNLGTAIEQAIVGMATISSGFVTNSLTLTLTDTNAAQNARALVLNLTQALSGAGTLNVPAIQKPYMIINATGQTVTVKVTGLTGVAVPNGTRAFLYNNGTDVGDFFNYASSLTLGTDLAVADGGTGASTACGARTNLGLGTIATQPASNVNITGGSITGITDLAIADGGTGASSAPAARTNLGATTVGSNFFTLTNPSAITFLRINADNTVSTLDAATFRTAIGAGTGGGSVSCVNTSGSVNGLTLTGGPITTTGTVTLGGGVNVSTITTGTLPVARGGTGLSCVGTSGNVLTSNGTAWVSQAAGGGANIQTFSASGTYTKPPGAKFVYVELWGAGGGGANRNVNICYTGAGGGGGAYTYKMFAAPQVGATETVTVGAGGAIYTNGGVTNFGTLLGAGGGGAAGVLGQPGEGGNAYTFTNPAGSLTNVNFAAPRTPATCAIKMSMFGRCNNSGASVYGGGSGAAGTGSTGLPASIYHGYISWYGGGGGAGSSGGPTTPLCCLRRQGGAGNLFGRTSIPGVIRSSATACSAAVAVGGNNTNPAGNFDGGRTGENGGLAAGGGGGFYPPASPGVGGSGGNGYAVVYTW